MGIDTAVDLVEVLRQNQLLESEQLEELAKMRASFADSRLLAKHLIDRSWLTPYQINQLFSKRGQDLVVGQYVLLERLGEGGMGQVFKAKHRRLDRIVALKVIRREHVANVDAVRRFRREIQASAQLSHSNIVMAYDADEANGTHFMVMEYVEGNDLASLVKQRGPAPIDKACEYMRQAALGFQHAHEKGMVHRDVKPSNLLVTRPTDNSVWGTTIKILDMGVARLLHPPDGMDSVSALTKEGRVVGTPDYMAPEQAANSAKADIRSDLYALGCSLYQLLTGQVPFPGGTPMEKLLKHRIEPPPAVEKLRPDVPPSVAAIVRRLMVKKPEERYQTPNDLVLALDALKNPSTVIQAAVPWNGPPPAQAAPMAQWAGVAEPGTEVPVALPLVPRNQFRRWAPVLTAIGIVVLGLAAILIALLMRPAKKAAEGTTEPETPAASPLKELADRVADPRADREALRRDLLAFHQEHHGTPQAQDAVNLLLKLPSPLDHLKHEQLPPRERDLLPAEVVAVLGESRQRHWGAVRQVAVSAEAKLAATVGDDNVIRLWDLATMNERQALPGGGISWLGFSTDGQFLLTIHNSGTLFVLGDLGGKAQEVQKLRVNLGGGGGNPAALSPDGRLLAVSVQNGVRLYDVRGLKQQMPPQVRATLRAPQRPGTLAFSAGGKFLAGTGVNSVFLWDTSEDEVKEQPSLARASNNGSGAVAFSTAGQVLAVTSEKGILRWDLSQTPPAELGALANPQAVYSLAFGPNGWLVSGGFDVLRLWDGTGPARKELYAFKRGHTHWSLGMAFVGNTSTLVSIGQDTTVRQWSVTATEAREVPAPLREPAGTVTAVAVSPDGRSVAVSTDNDATIRLWELGRGMEKPTGLPSPSSTISALSVSPDSQTLVAGLSSNARFAMWSFGTDSPQLVELPAPADLKPLPGGTRLTALAFAPDGKSLAAAFNDQSIRVLTLKPRTWRLIGQHGDTINALAFSPDGKTLASGGEAGKDPRSLRLWNLAQTSTWNVPQHGGNLLALAFSPDGKLLVGAGHLGQTPELSLWELGAGTASKRQLSTARPGSSQPLTGVVFLPDGGSLATAGRDGQVLLQGAASGHATRPPWRLPGPVRSLAATLDGRYLVTANANGTVYLIRVAPNR